MTNISPKFVEFEQKLNEIHANQIHSDNLLALVNGVHTKLDSAERFRIKVSEVGQSRH